MDDGPGMSQTIESNRDWRLFWNDELIADWDDNLYRQVGRTVGGTPTPPKQVELAVNAVTRGLSIDKDDMLLDLCCGNGLVTVRLASFCRAVVGVDYSTALIEVANARSASPSVTYLVRPADELTPSDFHPDLPTKICLNCALQHFTSDETTRLLRALRQLSSHPIPFYLTDVPDVEKLREFYNTPERWSEFEHRRAMGIEAIGTWWSRRHLVSLFEREGYRARIVDIEAERHTAHYRFDVFALPLG